MEKIVKVIDFITYIFGIIAGAMIIGGTSLVLTEIVMRGVFNKTLYITEEYTAYLMLGISFLGLAYGLKERSHVRMSFLFKVFKGRSSVYLDLYAFTVAFVLFSIITVATYNFFWDALITEQRSMQVSRTLLAIPKSAMPLGSFVMTLQCGGEILRSILKLRSGDIEEKKAEEPEEKIETELM